MGHPIRRAALCNEGRGGRRRHPAQTKTRNLLERLDRERNAVLRFLDDLTVPFTNNLPERDLRMLKTRQHISGSFRTALGAQRFATIRGYLQTARKQGQPLGECYGRSCKVARGNPTPDKPSSPTLAATDRGSTLGRFQRQGWLPPSLLGVELFPKAHAFSWNSLERRRGLPKQLRAKRNA